MGGLQTVGGVLAAALTAGAAWFGVSAATADSERSASDGDRVEFRGWPGRPADSVAQVQRLARGNNTLAVVTEEKRFRFVDVGAEGESTGDFFVLEETVYSARGREVIGEDTVRCELGIRTFNCEATIRLANRGKITIAGALFGPRDIVFPIIGGTQDFSRVSGQMKVYELRGGRSLLVFELMR